MINTDLFTRVNTDHDAIKIEDTNKLSQNHCRVGLRMCYFSWRIVRLKRSMCSRTRF